MSPRRTVARLVSLIGIAVSCAAAYAQTPGPGGSVVTEARRREILRTVDVLTSETLTDILRRAEAGDAEAQVLVGLALDRGKGVAKDRAKAVEWFRKAAEAGHPVGQNALASAYATGDGLPQDYPQALEWYGKAAAQGYSSAQANLGFACYGGQGVAQDRAQAAAWFRRAADQGHPGAQRALGVMYANGQGVPRDDAQAVAWYRKAAEQGDDTAQVDLALAYENGNGVRKDKDEAEKWFKKASDQGNPIGSFEYGFLYLEKPGPGRTDPVATLVGIKSLKLSAEQGYPVAAHVLGEIFTGRLFRYHVETDDLEACTWYLTASNLDKEDDWGMKMPKPVEVMRKDLSGRIAKIRKSLGATQYTECERRASDWKAAHGQPRKE
jgi:uncharacterized protein